MKRTMQWGVTVDGEFTYTGQKPTKGRHLAPESLSTSKRQAIYYALQHNGHLVRVLVVR